jgi:hypothetical protein
MITQEQEKQQEQGTQLLKMLTQEAWKNPRFKEQLIKNPVTTIQEFTGNPFDVPENQKFVVVDQSDESVFYFNIPKDPENFVLTPEQLEIIAGGGPGPGDLSYDLGTVIGGWLKKAVDYISSCPPPVQDCI